MNIKYLIIATSVLLIVISVCWGISQNQYLEPWTAVIGAVLSFLGLFYPSNNNSKSFGNNVNQSSFFSFFNSSSIKKVKGKIKQLDFFSLGNKKNIEN